MKKERIIWTVVVAAVLALSGFQIRDNILCKKKLINHEFYNRRLKCEIETLKAALDKNEPRLINIPELSEIETLNLKKLGLYEPESDLKSDLILHNELIPYKGVLGGTMGFFGKEYIRILNDRVFAYFEDGHIDGYMVLEYKVSSGGKISWKVLYSYLDDGENK